MRLAGAVEPSFGPTAMRASAAPHLDLARSPLPAAAFAGLFPDFAIRRSAGAADAVIAGWANMPGAARRRARAAALHVPFVEFGEGLLRAAPRAGVRVPALSVIASSIAGPASPADRLSPERVLARRDWETEELLRRAAAARKALIAERLGGNWWHRGGKRALPSGEGYALVALEGWRTADVIENGMIEAALAENPAERVIVWAPGSGSRRPLARALDEAARRGAAVITEPLNYWAALDHAERVYSAGGETGFLALLAGRAVRCFAASFHTGWGVTEDDAAIPQHAFRRTLDEIFAGSCLLATRYLDPFRNTAASFEDTLALLADWRRIEEANRRIGVCVGMSFWKRRRVAEFVASSAAAPVFRRTVGAALKASLDAAGEAPRAIAVWASRIPPGLPEAAERHGVPLIRVEDGFVRSVGLGADFLPPASLVFDSGGMYYDPRTRSDLETLLRETEFTPALIARAGRLAQELVLRGVTKYNLAGAPDIALPGDRRTILVPGQVEDDFSVLHGGGAVRANLDLLREVRTENPEAFILYKPHPDVLAGHRKGAVPDADARRYADLVVRNVSTAALLDRIDEVHMMTSLAGFEALLRRRRVVVYGRPFYAGWGLTEDRLSMDRGRQLSLEELVAGVLILYPRYLDPLTRLPCGPELIIERLDRPELWRAGPVVRARRLQGALARRLRRFGASR
ncbi:MAG TPA: hypothetical protein VF007_12500 [Stellaceae bacterium]